MSAGITNRKDDEDEVWEGIMEERYIPVAMMGHYERSVRRGRGNVGPSERHTER